MRAAALPHLQAIVAGSRSEPGCMTFTFAFDVDDDHLVRIFEIFADDAALAAHRETAHFKAWRACWEEAGIGDRVMTKYDVASATPL